MIISIESLPTQINTSNIMQCSSFAIGNPYNYFVSGNLYWKNKKGEQPIMFNEEIEKDSIEFWVENLNYENVIKDLKENAFLKNKVYLDGYKFVVEIEKIAINSDLKITLSDSINVEIKDEIILYINHEVNSYNQKNIKNKKGGIIHSIVFKKNKNKKIEFSVDYGSSGEDGIYQIFKILNESKFEIFKVEVKGL
jgi:hypothetical protein